jgi:DNA polymerase-3 subunit epsilon
MREICFDTETTGLDPNQGHRLVELGGVELINRVPTGNNYHVYINPERDMPTEAFEIHGLSEAFLADKPVFADVVEDFLDFLGDATLVIHNAGFDMKFLNAELKACGRPGLPMSRAIDTVAMARAKFPGAAASLDALCKRFEIDNSARTKHGALLDAELLAEVYIELTGGRQTGLSFADDRGAADDASPDLRATGRTERPIRPARPHAPSDAEIAAHAAFLEKLASPIWKGAE